MCLVCFYRLESMELPSVGAKSVLVKWLAAPVNPSHINMIQGKKERKKHTLVTHTITFV